MANKTVLVNVRFSPEEVRPLQELALRLDRSLSYVVRTLALSGVGVIPVAVNGGNIATHANPLPPDAYADGYLGG